MRRLYRGVGTIKVAQKFGRVLDYLLPGGSIVVELDLYSDATTLRELHGQVVYELRICCIPICFCFDVKDWVVGKLRTGVKFEGQMHLDDCRVRITQPPLYVGGRFGLDGQAGRLSLIMSAGATQLAIDLPQVLQKQIR